MKAVLFSLAMAVGSVYSVPANAQEGLRGFFDRGDNSNYVNFDETDLGEKFDQDFGGPDLGFFGKGVEFDLEDISLQDFGETSVDITFQSFGDNDSDVPLGGGLLILMMSSIGYVTIKKKTNTNE